MQFKLLTYNLLYNKALARIGTILEAQKPDILLIQEYNTAERNSSIIESKGYKLANFSNSFHKHNTTYGVATYYNPKTVSVISSRSFDLPRSVYELMLILFYGGNKPRTVLKTDFISKIGKKQFVVYNMHLSYFNTNSLRIKQIKEMLKSLTLNSHPVLIGGDFNYMPYRRRDFEKVISEYNLKEATSTIPYTFEKKIFWFFKLHWKLDYILYHNIHTIRAKRIETTDSDHYPILCTFSIT